MKFQIKRVLNERQMRKAKWSVVAALLFCTFTLGQHYLVHAEGEIYEYNGESFKSQEIDDSFGVGKIVYYSKNVEVCNSSVLVPGTALLPNGLLAVAYGLSLVYLFLGIGIVSDIFMNGIERITAQTQIIKITDSNGQVIKTQKVKVWNPTVANLTLMALGSSAPEIILSVLETVLNLGGCPGELGASTIVGSASFNLLVISAVSIYAVNEKNDNDPERDESVPKGVKKIYDMGVFSITAFSSIFAYVWMYICLSDQMITTVEAWLTFLFFFLLILMAWGADKWKSMQVEKERLLAGLGADDDKPVIEYQAIDIYRELIAEKNGQAAKNEEEKEKRNKMKNFLKETMNTDQIDRINMDELKKAVDGDQMISRIKYRKQVGSMMSGKRAVVAKGEVIKQEHAHAENLDEKQKNEFFGFKCLHYSVSEASGSLRIYVDNKKGAAGSVRVLTIDQEAIAGNDYEKVDTVLNFKQGERTQYIDVIINDDDNWEPDEDFFVQLLDPVTGQELKGDDCRTRVTIIDDDKPGQIAFEESKVIKALATEEVCEVVIVRKNGSDGKVTVDFETVQLDKSDHTATPDVDYTSTKGTLVFEQGETSKIISISILQREDVDMRDESFGLQLSNITPAGAKLSKKSFQIINIVTDIESKKKAEALAQLLQKIEDEEEQTWGSQFITACMLHPTKNEDGEIQDITGMEGFLHFSCIGWKLFFSFIPPPHYGGGLPCFFLSLCFIGIVTYVVGEFANLFGCVLNIQPSITAITFVALGTSLPDTFASMAAAVQEKYADSAIGNVTGSNSVNVFLGLGLPWVIAAMWESGNDAYESEGYYVPAGSLGFSVIVFCVCAIICVIFLVIRRKVVGGELGGSSGGRIGSAMFLTSLWLLYIVMSILQAENIGGLGEAAEGATEMWGITIRQSPNPACQKVPVVAPTVAAGVR